MVVLERMHLKLFMMTHVKHTIRIFIAKVALASDNPSTNICRTFSISQLVAAKKARWSQWCGSHPGCKILCSHTGCIGLRLVLLLKNLKVPHWSMMLHSFMPLVWFLAHTYIVITMIIIYGLHIVEIMSFPAFYWKVYIKLNWFKGVLSSYLFFFA